MKVSSTLLITLESVPFAYRLFIKDRMLDSRIQRYEFVIHDGSEMAADPKLELVYIHFPFPHPPGAYDRASGRLDISNPHSYLDNLALTDFSFGVVRRAMEQTGVWRDSAIIVSSDHWWRSDLWKTQSNWREEEGREVAGRATDHRVPFIVKLPRNADPMTYEKPINTVATRQVVMELLSGRLKTSKDLAAWFEGR